MNFKKSFVMCLSMLISLTPASLHAMEEEEFPGEKDILLLDSSKAITLKEEETKEDVDCPICLGTSNLNNEQKELKQGTNCRHKFHTFCIDEWQKHKNTCPSCRKPFLEEAIESQDIHSFPEMQGKSDDEIIEFLVKPLRDGTYYDICFSFSANSPFNHKVFYYPNEGGRRSPQAGIPLRLQTPEGLKMAAIEDSVLRGRVWNAAANIRSARRHAVLVEARLQHERRFQHRHRFCDTCDPKLFATILLLCGLSSLAYYYS